MALPSELLIQDLLIVTYALPPERLRRLVPAALALDTVRGVDGEELALFSVVTFVSREVRPRGLPTVTLNLPQLNFRTYVRPPQRAVYFLRADLGLSPLGMALATLGGVMVQGLSASPGVHNVEWSTATGNYERYAVEFGGSAGYAYFVARTADVAGGPPVGFDSWEAAAEFITQRPVGYAALAFGGLARLDVEHPLLQPDVGELLTARYAVWDRLGVLAPEEALRPHSVLLQREAVFTVSLPYPVLGGIAADAGSG